MEVSGGHPQGFSKLNLTICDFYLIHHVILASTLVFRQMCTAGSWSLSSSAENWKALKTKTFFITHFETKSYLIWFIQNLTCTDGKLLLVWPFIHLSAEIFLSFPAGGQPQTLLEPLPDMTHVPDDISTSPNLESQIYQAPRVLGSRLWTCRIYENVPSPHVQKEERMHHPNLEGEQHQEEGFNIVFP